MVSKRLMGVWAFFDICLLACGALSVAMSLIWKQSNAVRNLVINNNDLTAGLAMGVALIVTFAISIGAIVQRNHVTSGLVFLNWTLIFDALGILVIGTFIWVYTLKERNNFHVAFSLQTTANKIAIQDHFKCCGYFNLTDLVELGGSSCPSQQAVTTLNTTCVGPITNFADVTLNDIFTSTYGFMAVVLCLLFTSLCVIKKRQEVERFKRIDAKRGGRGFV